MSMDMSTDFGFKAENDENHELDSLGAGLGVHLQETNADDTDPAVAALEVAADTTQDPDTSNGFNPYDTASLYIK